MSKRQYRNQVALIVSGVECAAKQASSLLQSADHLLLIAKDHSLALSIGVLALEEVGKALLIDGLLFAKAKDDKTEAFEKGHRKHTDKLAALMVFPSFIEYLALIDPRKESDTENFRTQLSNCVHRYYSAKANLLRDLNLDSNLQGLDSLKQAGFYSSLQSGSKFVVPSTVITRHMTLRVLSLATPCVEALNIAFVNGTGHYVDYGVAVRKALNESDHAALEERADIRMRELFNGLSPNDDANSDSHAH